MNPKVSIVITCYNLGKYLNEAIGSVEQYPNKNDYEIILVDDGSTDNDTIEIIENLKNPRLTIIRQANMGLAKARNNGIKSSKGDYIISLDADNKIRPNFISHCINFFDEEKSIGVIFGDFEYFENKSGIKKVGKFDYSKIIIHNYIDACAAFRKTVWQNVSGFDENMPIMGWEDWDFWLRLSSLGVQFKYIEEVCFDYRVRKDSMINNTNKHATKLYEYIFNKRELEHLKNLRHQYFSLEYYKKTRVDNLDHITTKKIALCLLERLTKKINPFKKKSEHEQVF